MFASIAAKVIFATRKANSAILFEALYKYKSDDCDFDLYF